MSLCSGVARAKNLLLAVNFFLVICFQKMYNIFKNKKKLLHASYKTISIFDVDKKMININGVLKFKIVSLLFLIIM